MCTGMDLDQLEPVEEIVVSLVEYLFSGSKKMIVRGRPMKRKLETVEEDSSRLVMVWNVIGQELENNAIETTFDLGDCFPMLMHGL